MVSDGTALGGPHAQLAHLQRTAGNAAVCQLLSTPRAATMPDIAAGCATGTTSDMATR